MDSMAQRVPRGLLRAAYRVLPERVWDAGRDVVFGESKVQCRMRTRSLAAAERRAAGKIGVKVVAVRYRGELLLAHPVVTFNASQVIAENARFVFDTLEAADVPYIVVDAPTQRRRVIALSSQQIGPAMSALREAGSGRPVYAGWVMGRKLSPSHRLKDLPDWARSGHALRVFEAYASPTGQPLSAADLGCDIEVWTEVVEEVPSHLVGEVLPVGSLLAPRKNRWTDALLADQREPVTVAVDGVPRPGLPAVTAHHQFDIDFPIDVVYTWVDGNDPAWQERKSRAHEEAGLGTLHECADNDSRFTSHDELRYSLRSLDMYANWVGQVYLVTDDQVPDWLDTEHPKIRVVSHRELFGGRGRLPTFNSHAIETQLHHLDHLSEHYLYMNDDVFFGRPISPDVFFLSNGLANYFVSTAKIGLGGPQPSDMPVVSAGKNNRDLLFKTFDASVTNKLKHVPHSQRRSVMDEMEERFPEVFEQTASHQFRSQQDYSVAASLHHGYAYAIGKAVPGGMRYFYADIAATQTPARLRHLLRNRDFDVFCLNDHDSSAMDPQEQAHQMERFLSSYFPLASSFEK
ncbi:MAG: stealth family protein [Actinobacteria bacterium]|nr:stealth family protein [Actinomycetota bacterium]